MRRFFASAVLTLTTTAVAVAEEPVLRTVDPLSGEQLWRTGGSLLLLIGLIIAALWFMRRVGAGPRGAGRQIAFVDALALGQKERIVLVQVGKEQILLGVSPGRVERVHVLEHPVEFNPETEAGFSDALRRAVTSASSPAKSVSDASS